MKTTITGFHQDADGFWVAELACGHSQHVRHRPPWQNRPWTLTEEGRKERIEAEIDCPLCDDVAAFEDDRSMDETGK